MPTNKTVKLPEKVKVFKFVDLVRELNGKVNYFPKNATYATVGELIDALSKFDRDKYIFMDSTFNGANISKHVKNLKVDKHGVIHIRY